MKKTASIAAAIAIAAGAIAIFALSSSDDGEAAATGNATGTRPGSLPSKTERIDDERDPERFDTLDAGMKELALELEKAAIKWQRNRPEDEGFHQLTNDWREFSMAKISALDIEQIRQLGEWMDSGSYSELHDYRKELITIWASREPEVVRARLMDIAEDRGFLGEGESGWKNAFRDEFADDLHHAYVGHAMKDPKSAWETFLKDEADPRMKRLVNGVITVSGIFKEYAAQLPGEAWSLALATQDPDHSTQMVEGFADGAPTGQDWEKKGYELAESLAARGIEASQWPFQSIGERWLAEDPVAALDWFARCAPEDALKSARDRLKRGRSDDPFEDAPARNSEEAAMLLKTYLLVEMFHSYKDRSRETVTALLHLNKHGEDQVALEALGELLGAGLYPMKVPLLEVIPGIPSPEDRNSLFLLAVRGIPNRSNGFPLGILDPQLEDPNSSLVAMRALAERLDLPAEIRAEAEATFRNVEEQELKALQKLKQMRRDGDNPFAPR
ncbi:hypothetical protein OKA04_15570 [Luteolibacter flavescens]|uniref:DUF4034 domain-containing protein n=1 Tax=Luteolibacter flavescens TaxID=1859460 RepID=A0ABT3FRD6_9BACT|nr:hypothetical protein [Luteolibacter flavescens]MCW1886156.1 hypothetical protein [Luteolibacter flavescens]